ncbi:MAG: lipopolysaccharide heptosyltransferase I, partial [Ottowia sp.]|nr:lipopolysaccharide heptosyltransferase I [Ottowia sp.]
PVRFFYQQGITIPSRTHVVMRGRLLAAQALGYTLDTHIDFGLTPQFADLTLLANDPYIVFVHAASRADKAWPTTSWINLGLHLISAGYRIVLPWGSPAEKEISQTLAQTLGPRAWVPPYLALPHIAGLLEKATATIGVDTGLSHMSVALNKPTIQLYQFDTAWRTGGLSAEKFINLGSKRHPPTGIQVQAALVALGLL